jgi:hypothetical protein
MREDFAVFLDIFSSAIAAVGGHYFHFAIAEAEDSIYRERVYCYELYHQMRERLPDEFGYVLCGEVDKSGHPILREALGAVKPDYIVHVPGSMDNNLVVIEVKPPRATPAQVDADIAKLIGFRRAGQYFAAIYLIYGGERPDHVLTKLRELPDRHRPLLFWHAEHGARPQRLE